jgi:hypothetical protein
MASGAAKDCVNGEKNHERSGSSDFRAEVEHHDYRQSESGSQGHLTASDKQRLEASQKLANPLAGLSLERLGAMGEEYARTTGTTEEEDIRAFRLGAMLASNQGSLDSIADLTPREREVIDREETHKWSNPMMLYWVIISKQYS